MRVKGIAFLLVLYSTITFCQRTFLQTYVSLSINGETPEQTIELKSVSQVILAQY